MVDMNVVSIMIGLELVIEVGPDVIEGLLTAPAASDS
jgi:hypothetical protein